MRRCSGSALLVVLFLSLSVLLPHASAQVDHITIAAGTDEDHALQAITSEQDAQKKVAMYRGVRAEVFREPGGRGLWQLATRAGLPGDRRSAKGARLMATRRWRRLRTISIFWCPMPASRSRPRTTPS